MSEQPTLFISDQPLRVDAGFNFEPIIRTLREFIQFAPDDSPLSICVTGGWGWGKSTLLQGLEELFKQEGIPDADESGPQYVTVWFDPWKLPSETEIHNALTRKILDVIERDSDFVEGAKIGLDRKDVLRVLGKRFLQVSPDEINSFYKAEARTQGTFVEIEDIFRRVTEVYLEGEDRRRRLVVFVDDLDRCRPPTVAKMLEAVKLFFNLPGLIFVFALDSDQLERCVAAEYGFTQEEAKEYLEKIFQLTVPLPRKGTTDLVDFLDSKLREISVDLGNKDLSAAIVNRFGRNLRNLKLFINSFSFQRRLIDSSNINEEALFKWLYLEATMSHSLTAATKSGLQEFVLALEFLAHGGFLHDDALRARYMEALRAGSINYLGLIAYAMASEQDKVPLESSNLNSQHRAIVDALRADGAVVETLKVIREGNRRLIDSDLNSMIYLTRRDELQGQLEDYPRAEEADGKATAMDLGTPLRANDWETAGDKLKVEKDVRNAYLCYLMAHLIEPNVEIHECDLADAFRKLGRLNAAKSLLSTSFERNPLGSYAIGEMALVYDVDLGDEETGNLLYRKAISCNAPSGSIPYNLAANLSKAGDHERAYIACLAACVKEPDDQSKIERLIRYARQAGYEDRATPRSIEEMLQELREIEAEGRYPWPLTADEEEAARNCFTELGSTEAIRAELSRLPF